MRKKILYFILGLTLGALCAGTVRIIMVRNTNRYQTDFVCRHQDAMLHFSRTSDTAVLHFYQKNKFPNQVNWSQISGMTGWRVDSNTYLDLDSNGIADIRIDSAANTKRFFILIDPGWYECTEIHDKEGVAKDTKENFFRWKNGEWHQDASAGGRK